MKVPAALFGLNKEVRPRVRRMVIALKNGVAWEEVVAAQDMLDTDTHEGLLVLDGPSSLTNYAPHFHFYFLPSLAEDARYAGRISEEIEAQIFEGFLSSPWALLGLFGRNNSLWLHPPERRRPFLRAALAFWDELYEQGERYTSGSTTPEDLWSLPSSLHYALANLGVPTETLKSPLPPGGLRLIVEMTEQNDG